MLRETKAPDATANHVLRVLASYADETGECWPALSTLAAQTQLAKSTVCRALERLEAANLISRVRSKGMTSSHYRIELSPSETDKLSSTATVTVREKDTSVAHRNGTVAQEDTEVPRSTNEGPTTTTQPAIADLCLSFVQAWNELAPKYGLSKVKTFSKDRKTKLTARLRGTEGYTWDAIREAIERSRGVHGQSWFGFDFILSEGNFIKLIEGKYPRPFGEKPNEESTATYYANKVRSNGNGNHKEIEHAPADHEEPSHPLDDVPL